LKKKVPVVSVAEPEQAGRLEGLPVEAAVALADLASAVKDGLLGFCADVGLIVMHQVMEDELTRRIGPKHARIPGRTANWHGMTTGAVRRGVPTTRGCRLREPKARSGAAVKHGKASSIVGGYGCDGSVGHGGQHAL
jgi:hypothetical protein